MYHDFYSKDFIPYIIKNKNVEGVVFDFWIGDETGRDWYDVYSTGGVWPEMRFIRDNMIKQGDVILECGAHHGITTVVLSNWVGDKGKVIAFEPVPNNCDIIKKNIDLNGLTNVILERKAVGSETGQINITGNSNTMVLIYQKGIEVEITCLDEYEYLQPSMLKIDVEGFEAEVLKGAKKILSRRPKIAIEIHTEALRQYYDSSIDEIFGLIDVGAYKLWVQWNEREEPKEYDMKKPISTLVHLFGIPRK